MLLRRLDDYQGWQVIHGGTSILLDPWLTDEPITGSFDRRQSADAVTLEQLRSEPTSIAAIALCTSVSDHARPQTLAALSDVPVLGPARAARTARAARRAGSTQVHALRPGDGRTFDAPQGGCIEITATRTGLPLGLIALGYLIRAIGPSGECQGRIWLEPHQPTAAVARSIAPIGLALLPMQSVTATLMPVTAGPRTSLAAAGQAQARAIVATATDPGRDMSSWQRRLYRVSAPDGGQVDPDGRQVQVLRLQPGESVPVPPG